MKRDEAIKILQMMPQVTEVELIFPDALDWERRVSQRPPNKGWTDKPVYSKSNQFSDIGETTR